MRNKKILSVILAVIMLMVPVLCLPLSAADDVEIGDYISTAYLTQKAKVDTMKLVFSSKEYGYDMYFDELSGEIALKNRATGEYTFSNPYDVGASGNDAFTVNSGAEKIRYSLLSQIMIKYTDTSTETSYYMSSYEHAALMGDQITYTQLSDGIRVEYALGTVESKRLLPRWIDATRFTEKIYNPLKACYSQMTTEEKFIFDHLLDSHYSLKDQTDEKNESFVAGWRTTYKCLSNNHDKIIYTLATDKNSIMKQIEALIRKYVPSYTYEELEDDHEDTGYEGDEKEPALFRLAIEYRFDENGFTASVPAKSIRYNETNYTLDSITILPYFGCSSVKTVGATTKDGGYIFIPDGSGTLLNYYNSDGTVKTGVQGTALYGMDYGYEDLSSSGANQEITRFPVYGLTENYSVTTTTQRSQAPEKKETTSYTRGYLAIIENGDSFAYITACLGEMSWVNYASASCEYNTVYASFTVKQTDTVSLGSSIGSAGEMTTSINTKYTGNYSIRYIMLSDPATAEAADYESYEPSYVGMAVAYRNYLEKTGQLTKLLDSEINADIPLYIQSFGTLDTDDTFMSIPVTKRVALTTFDNLIEMSTRLKEAGVGNVNYILTGFANGTIETQKYPGGVRWERKVGGKAGLARLLRYAEEEDVTIFPNFDFANVTIAANGFRFRVHASQTMSGRYVTKRAYDPVYQSMTKAGFSNLVSASSFNYLYNRFFKRYQKYGVGGLAAMTLGTDLNSDFNVDDALTREDSKEYTVDLLKQMKSDNGNLLVSGGNSYVLPYVTDLIDVSMDNSRFSISSASVPFTGMVLHGYTNFAGSAINMAGDLMYEILKSIENGSALYFILSYQNTNKLKNASEDASQYYSVTFDTWFDDVVKYYTMVNDAIGDLQTAVISDHSYITSFRLSNEDAYVLFSQKADAEATYESTKAAYYASITEVDRIIANQGDPSKALATETANRTAFEKATTRLELVDALIEANDVGSVVAVTYCDDSGKETTFYINYNSFEVAVYVNGSICRLAANSFINADDLVECKYSTTASETITAWKPTTNGINNYRIAQDAMDTALESGTPAQIARAQENLYNAINVIVTEKENVVCASTPDGGRMFINYTDSIVIVKVSDTRYEMISARSYLTVD